MEAKWVITAVASIYALYSFWPTIKTWIPSLPSVDIGLDNDDDDFKAYQQLQRRAIKLNRPLAAECLEKSLVPLFGIGEVSNEK